jgi:hypothetical protein
VFYAVEDVAQEGAVVTFVPVCLLCGGIGMLHWGKFLKPKKAKMACIEF